MNIASAVSEGHADAAGGATVLVVDDSRAQRLLLSRALKSWGYSVLEADSGEDAIAHCERDEGIALVISDWIMPGMSGVDFCRAYRKLRGDCPSYFILLTAQTDREALADGLESGADDFLSKPFNTVELRARLRAGERVVQAQAELTRRNAQLGDALEELREINDAIDRDLIEAQKLQEALVPERHRCFGRAAVSLLYRPSGRIGGDLVGMFEAGNRSNWRFFRRCCGTRHSVGAHDRKDRRAP